MRFLCSSKFNIIGWENTSFSTFYKHHRSAACSRDDSFALFQYRIYRVIQKCASMSTCCILIAYCCLHRKSVTSEDIKLKTQTENFELALASSCCRSIYCTRRSHLPSTEYLVTVIQCLCDEGQRRRGAGALGFPLQPLRSGVVSQMAHRIATAPTSGNIHGFIWINTY